VADLIQRIEDSVRRRALFGPGAKILVAVSGGLDSMVLLHALNALSRRHRWKLSVAHFNHRLRGRASDADERLVRKTAAALRIPVIVERADVKQFARRSGLSIEMAARKLRHEFFARVARERKSKTIAVAHHADDQVELFFIRLLRGAAPEGLTGMKWRSPSAVDRTISLVRPLLDCAKTELAAFARDESIQYREDASNGSNDFLRNRIRNELLPLLKKKYQPATTAVVLRLMEILRAESELVAESGKRKAEKGKKSEFGKWPVAIQRRLLQGSLAGIGIVPDFELVETLRQSPDVPVSVRPNFSVTRDDHGHVRLQEQPSATVFNAGSVKLSLGQGGKAAFGEAVVTWRVRDRRFPSFGPGREMFDAKRIGTRVVLRHWRPGDRFRPIGMTSQKKLQDLFMDAKVARDERHRRIIATTAAGQIFWVEGLRIAEDFKVTATTKRRLVWEWRRKS